MARIDFDWTQGSPEQIARTILGMVEAAPSVAEEVTQNEASRAEAHMKVSAPWNDRTTNARSGLSTAVERTGPSITMYLYGTMDYTPYLELGTRRMGKYPIIVPTQRLWRRTLADEVGRELMELFRV